MKWGKKYEHLYHMRQVQNIFQHWGIAHPNLILYPNPNIVLLVYPCSIPSKFPQPSSMLIFYTLKY